MADCYGRVSANGGGDVVNRLGVRMGYAVGVDFGSTMTRVALAAAPDDQTQIAYSASVVAQIPSVIFLDELGPVVVGGRAEELGIDQAAPARQGFHRNGSGTPSR